MFVYNSYQAGKHFLQIPGPTNVPDRILRAMDHPTIDHRGPEFQKLANKVLSEIRKIFQTQCPVIIYPCSGSGAWEAALVNTLSPGEHVLMYETGHFATLWKKMAEKLSLKVQFIEGAWHRGIDPVRIEERLAKDTGHKIKAVCVVHNETSTGITSNILAVRRAIDNARHPALLFADTISSLGSIDYRHDEWGVDVAIGCSQKGLMLPPGIGMNVVSGKAVEASKHCKFPRSFWSWNEILEANKNGFWPYTPPTNMLYGLAESCDMLLEEGLENVFKRHQRHAEATRQAVWAWGLELVCKNASEYSQSLTAVVMPKNDTGKHYDADKLRQIILRNFDMSLGTGLGKLAGWVFRIGHLGDLNDITLLGALAGIEMGLELAGVPHQKGGVQAAMSYLATTISKK
ncbi:MAG: pyridoxal-phosphate-dependent aminotransferase family protein [Desulfomonilaceae bacterium]